MRKQEENIHNTVCKYLNIKYPKVFYVTDLSGIKLTIGSAKKAKLQRHPNLKTPDLLILHPNKDYAGLIIELKRDVNELYTKSGEIRNNKHIQAQKKSIEHLQEVGYKALFCCGLDDAINTINKYFE